MAACKSLSVSKKLQPKDNIGIAELVMQLAFEEMCGLSPPVVAKQTLCL